jgi:hypothetical protein
MGEGVSSHRESGGQRLVLKTLGRARVLLVPTELRFDLSFSRWGIRPSAAEAGFQVRLIGTAGSRALPGSAVAKQC